MDDYVKWTGPLVLLISLLSGGCSQFTIDTRHEADFDFSRVNTFAWSNLAPDVRGDAEYARPEVDEMIRGNIVTGFEDRGFRRASSQEEADVLLAYRLVIESTMTERVLNDSQDTPPGWGPDSIDERQYASKTQNTFVSEYKEATLVIDVYAPGAERLVWRGAVQTELHAEDTTAKRADRFRRITRDLLKKFPPK